MEKFEQKNQSAENIVVAVDLAKIYLWFVFLPKCSLVASVAMTIAFFSLHENILIWKIYGYLISQVTIQLLKEQFTGLFQKAVML